MDKEQNSQSFYHLRNWENLSPSHQFYFDYTEEVNWVYQNISSRNVTWTVWDGGYNGWTTASREPFFKDERIYVIDATNNQIEFLQSTFNELDSYIEPDFEQVSWDYAADIRIWNVYEIPNSNVHGYGFFHGVRDHGSVEAIVDVWYLNSELRELGITDEEEFIQYLTVHEIGHAIGLSHPGIDGEDYPSSDLYTSKDTIMSYNRDENGNYGTTFTDLDIKALQSIWGSEGSYGGTNFDINKNSPVLSKEVVSSHSIGTEYELSGIADYDGNLHANTGSVSDDTKTSYKYQGLIDVNADGTKEAIYTNKESGRWVTGSINSSTGEIDYSDHGSGGTTRVVGIYIDPLVTSGEVEQFGPHDSQRRFQNDLKIDNLIAKTSGDYDGDGFQEVYWKTNDGTAYLRALMHADGNIQYANYQSEAQMSDYLTSKGYESVISDIV